MGVANYVQVHIQAHYKCAMLWVNSNQTRLVEPSHAIIYLIII